MLGCWSFVPSSMFGPRRSTVREQRCCLCGSQDSPTVGCLAYPGEEGELLKIVLFSCTACFAPSLAPATALRQQRRTSNTSTITYNPIASGVNRDNIQHDRWSCIALAVLRIAPRSAPSGLLRAPRSAPAGLLRAPHPPETQKAASVRLLHCLNRGSQKSLARPSRYKTSIGS